ncbi:MAG TPA: hypothetical protein VIF43_02155 [Patescibacteria group bacterium]|jgi:hypothetical protein
MATVIISYLVYLLAIAGFAVAGIYHARKFGFPGDKTTLASGIYLFALIVIIIGTFVTLGGVQVSGGV